MRHAIFNLAEQGMIQIIGTYEWNRATSIFDVFDLFFSSKVVMMRKLVVHQLTNYIFSRIIYYRKTSVDVLKLQPVFLFKEWQLSEIFSDADVQKSSLKQLF